MSQGNKKDDIKTGFGTRDICVMAITAAAVMILTGIICFYSRISPIIICTSGTAIYLLFFLTYLLSAKKQAGSTPESTLHSALGGIFRETIYNMSFPVFIYDENDLSILWFNQELSLLAGNVKLYGTPYTELFGGALMDAFNENGGCRQIKYQDKIYLASAKRMQVNGKGFIIVTLSDVTKAENLKRELEDNRPVVAYIVMDNLDELRQYEQAHYREAAGLVSDKLSAWTKEIGGLLKEYERDKYLLVIKSKYLKELTEKKFDILDKVRDIHVGVGAIPITVSIGVAQMDASLFTLERNAKDAIEMALERGGDQAALKTDSTMSFFGGRTKSIRSKNRVRARVISGELMMYISKASNVLIMGHRYADFDAFGSAVGIARMAKFCGVNVNIITDFSDSNLDRCRKVMEKDSEYDGVFINSESALDLINSDTLLVVVDACNKAIMESEDIYNNCRNKVIIDHHRKPEEFSSKPLISYIETAASAASELVTELIEHALPKEELRRSEANMLLAGIILDTKQFTQNTTSRTFGAALYLKDRGASPEEIQELFKTGLNDYIREGKFRTNVVIYRQITAISLAKGEGEAEDRIIAAKSADKLLSVCGVQASFAMIKIGDCVHVSARSTGAINVQLILEELKGGGHYDSAGAQIKAQSVTDALVKLKSAIDVYLDNTAPSEK